MLNNLIESWATYIFHTCREICTEWKTSTKVKKKKKRKKRALGQKNYRNTLYKLCQASKWNPMLAYRFGNFTNKINYKQNSTAIKLDPQSNVFIALSHAHFCFEVMRVYLVHVDRFQNAIPKLPKMSNAAPRVQSSILKSVHAITLMTKDSIVGLLKMLTAQRRGGGRNPL